VCLVSAGGRLRRPLFLDVVGGSCCQAFWQKLKTFAFPKNCLSFVRTYKWGVQKGSKKCLFGGATSYGKNRSHRMQNSPPQFSLKCGVFGGFWPWLGPPPKRLDLRPQGLQTRQGLPSPCPHRGGKETASVSVIFTTSSVWWSVVSYYDVPM
jgi:hypothetical protein